MPPALFHSSTASLAPLSSHAPSELSWPLCASTSAILMGPVSSPELLLLLPGALQAAMSARAAPRRGTATRRRANTDMTFHLWLKDWRSPCEPRQRQVAVLRGHPDRR